MQDKPIYYDGTKLLSLKDINGNVPEIFICTSNRTAGKTTYFNRLLINGFMKKNEKFCILYRFILIIKVAATLFIVLQKPHYDFTKKSEWCVPRTVL